MAASRDRHHGPVAALCGTGAMVAALLAAGCQPIRKPPPSVFFHGLPVSGRLADARRAGFTDCFNMDVVHLRCRRHAVFVSGSGPFEAAVDLEGGEGEGGFDQLVIWHSRDNYAVYAIADALEKAGWKSCSTSENDRGDQAIYRRQGSPVWASEDISYFAKRRIRLLPEWNRAQRGCTPT